ncbi:MAG: NUDIX domain-containing protein [Clostridia bacterium]|nr:NUDIX domain-containing protein [Clostridia bacterium]
MKEVISAGGIVILKNQLLMLKKKNGDWVLPKGRIEKGETLEETALREVKEETNVDGEIIDYIGVTTYRFCNYWTRYRLVEKTVSWYLMIPKTFDLIPLAHEGFVEARFVSFEEVLKIARYEDEKKVIKKALELWRKRML